MPASRFCLRFLVFLAVAGASPQLAAESSPADKATARDVATQGIQRYRDGQYTEALDLLKRAQALYDAPVHQQYIARSERELGHWVEAAEAFRTLSRRSLEPDAPAQWVSAVEEAGRELEELEPKIPRLLIRVTPTNAKVTRLSIDQVDVPVAVVGIERLVNPGERVVRVEAEGHAPVVGRTQAIEGETARLDLSLEAAPPVVAPEPSRDAKPPTPAAKDPSETRRRYAVLLGLRFGLAAPGGNVPIRFARPSQENGNLETSEIAGNGGALELRAGMTGPLKLGVFQRWIGYGFISAGSLGKKDVPLPDASVLASLRQDGVELEANPSFVTGGFALGVGQARDRFGGFAELAVTYGALELAYTTSAAVPMCDARATATRRGTGPGGRLSAGVGFPISDWGMLAPYLLLSVESMNSLSFSRDDCFETWYQQHDVEAPPASETVSNPASHTFFGVGIGGEVFLGL